MPTWSPLWKLFGPESACARRKALLIGVCLAALCALGHCVPGVRRPPETRVVLTWQRDAFRLIILLQDMKLKAEMQPRDPLPYSHNAYTAVWLGTEFPHDKLAQVVRYSRKYYPELRYVALSDLMGEDVPEQIHHQLYIGGATETALRLKLRAWTNEEFEKLDDIKTKEQLHAYVRERYKRAEPEKKDPKADSKTDSKAGKK